MQDHASKGKQDQIGVAKGRHWGIIGRKLYSRAVPVSTAELSDSEYFRFCVPISVCAGLRFRLRVFSGGVWATVRRLAVGVSVRFSRPETVLRLVDWARTGPASPTP